MNQLKALCVLALLCAAGASLRAQTPATSSAAPVAVRATGAVRTASGVALPGATVRLTHLESGRAWVSWTDEQGQFVVPGLPTGRYRVEAELLGFEPVTAEHALAAAASPDTEKKIELSLRTRRIEDLAAKTVESAGPTSAPKAPETKPASTEATGSTPRPSPEQPVGASSTAPPAPNASGPAPTPSGPAPGDRGRQGQQGGNTQQQRQQQMMEQLRQQIAQRGGFQQVDPTGQGAPGAAPGDTAGPGAMPDAGALGDASSADSFLIQGSVGRGATAGSDMAIMGLGALMGMGGMMPFGGFGPGMDFGAAGMMPAFGGVGPGGQVIVFQGPGGPGGPGGGAQARGGQGQQGRGQGQGQRGQQGQQAQNRQGQAQGQARQGQQGQGQGGGQGRQPNVVVGGGFGQGMEALWGMQQLARQQANRMRFSFYNRYGNNIWDARPYSLTEADPRKVNTYRESFGMNLGGPLRIPKVYDGREKTFFFVNYDLSRNRSPVDTFATVPLPAERGGDFTARALQLFDPASNLSGPRTPLGSVIPAARLDPAAGGLLEFIPLPNLPGTVQNFHLQTRVPQSTDRVNVRLLHTISPKLNLQVMYSLSSTRNRTVQAFPQLGSRVSSLGQNVNIGLTQRYSPRFTHDSRINWSRNRTDTLNRFAFDRDVAGALGITGISTDPINFGVPRLDYTNFTDANDPVPGLRRNQTLRILDNISYAHAKHTLRAGAEIRRMQNNNRNDPTARGAFIFTGLMTSQLDAQGRPRPGTGFDFADFLLGLPQSTTVRFGSSSAYFRNWGFVGYFQDDWRIHPRFTLNTGIRYEAVTPYTELFDKIANLDVNDSITAAALVLPGQTAPFSGKVGRSLVRGDYNNWSPRLSFAWRPKIKRPITVRAGYGMFYNLWIYNQLFASMANQPPHAQAQTRLTSSARVLSLQNGFPPEPPGTVPNTIAVDPDYRIGYAQIWNLAVETQLVQNLTLDVTYTGTKGTHLDLLRSPNRALPTGPLNTELTRRIPNAPGFTYDTFGASSIYHALQVRVQKRFTRGWMLMGTYTFGKSLDNASTIGGGAQVVVQDDSNFDAERGLSSFNIRHQFRAFWNWELPFGERKRWAQKGWKAAVLSNWSVSGNATVLTGTPFTARVLGSAANNSGTGNSFSERPDQVADASLDRGDRDPLHFFNTAAFALPPAGRFGNASRNTIPGPGALQFNLSTGRFFRFGKDGQRRLDFRWEVQNLLNTPNFTGLNTVVNSSTYGRVQGARPMRAMDLQLRVNF